MKVYVITELYADYKHTDTTAHGAYTSYDKAKKELDEMLKERYDYMAKSAIKEKYHSDEYSKIVWEYDDGDSLTKFYIDELEVA